MVSPWFDGQIDDVNNWVTNVPVPGGLVITSTPSKIQVGAVTQLRVWSADLRYLDSICTLTVGNDGIAAPTTYTAPMQVDPSGGVSALFEIEGIAVGNTNITASVPDL